MLDCTDFDSPHVVTNAAGSLNPSIPVGTSTFLFVNISRLTSSDCVLSIVVVINDHLALPNLTGMNPLLGPQTSPDHPRFLPLSDAYSVALRRLVFLAADKLQIPDSAFAEGTYAWVSGPTYETPAEGRFLRGAGADVVGMSTVPEVLAGREEGLNVAVLSLVTNFVVIPEKPASIREQVKAEVCGLPIFLTHEADNGLALGNGICTTPSAGRISRRGPRNWQAESRTHEAACSASRRSQAGGHLDGARMIFWIPVDLSCQTSIYCDLSRDLRRFSAFCGRS